MSSPQHRVPERPDGLWYAAGGIYTALVVVLFPAVKPACEPLR